MEIDIYKVIDNLIEQIGFLHKEIAILLEEKRVLFEKNKKLKERIEDYKATESKNNNG